MGLNEIALKLGRTNRRTVQNPSYELGYQWVGVWPFSACVLKIPVAAHSNFHRNVEVMNY